MPTSLESELGVLLDDLLAGQNELIETLNRKRELLAAADVDGLAAMAREEERLLANLQTCLCRREQLLKRAANEGLPSANIRSLASALPPLERKPLREQLELAGARSRLLQHHSLTNWVAIQRTLIHLSQLLEIIATGGRLQPTYYEEGGRSSSTGSLVDRAA